jgi:uncharacterized membrane protein
MAFQVRPWLDFEAREIHAGRIPLWNPYEWGGQTNIGQVQPALANPLNWPLFLWPLRDGHIPIGVLHWYWVLIHWVGAAFAYALCRDLGAGFGASLLGGAIFGLTGFVGHTDWPQILMSSIWIPLVLLFFARVYRGERPVPSAALCGAALGMAFLAGHHQVPVFTAVLMGALWLWQIVRRPRQWLCPAVFLTTWLLVSAVQVLPALEYGRRAVRWAGAPEPLRWNQKVPYSVHAEYSFHAREIPGFVLNGRGVHVNPFVGFVVLGLAAAAIALNWRSREVRLFGVVAIGGLLLALGSDTPVERIAYAIVPMVEKARFPSMAIVLCHAGIAALASLALAKAPRWAPFVALALFCVEAIPNGPRMARLDRPGAYLKMVRDQADIATFLKSQPGWFRVEIDDSEVPYNFGDLYGIEQFGGAVSSMPERVFQVLGHEETPRLFNIRYRVARQPSNAAQVEVFRSASGLNVFRDPRIPAPDFRIEKRVPGQFVFDVDLPSTQSVVVPDPVYPGWRVWVDGNRRPIGEFVGQTRTVDVPAGRHRIQFRYVPGSVYWGLALTIVGFLLTFATVLLEPFTRIYNHNPAPPQVDAMSLPR